MGVGRSDVARILDRLAGSLALLVALSLPLGHGLLAYRDLAAALEFKARVKAAAVDGLIATTPELWLYAENQIDGLISREPRLLGEERITVRDAQGEVVAGDPAPAGARRLSRSHPLSDAGRVVGRVDVSAPVDAIALATGIAGIVGVLLGALVYAAVQLLPLRALRRLTDALIDEKRQGEALLEALRASEENLAITLDSIGDAVIATDAGGRVTRMNPTAERLTGWPLDAARGRALAEVFVIVNAETRRSVVNPVQQVMERGEVVGLANHTVLLARDGAEYHIADSAAPIRNAAGEVVGIVLVVADVSGKYRAEAALHETQAILQAAMDQTPAGIAVADAPSGSIRYVNHAGRALRRNGATAPVCGVDFRQYFSGISFIDGAGHSVDLEQLPLARVLRGEERDACEYVARYADGEERTVVSSAAPIRNARGEVIAAMAVFLDISERKMAENEIKRLAFHDQLTGLPNRRLLLDRLSRALATRSRHGNGGALLFVDLDNFKTINDTLGHDFGDELLRQVATRLTGCMRAGDTVARIGGDEFVVLLGDLSRSDEEAASQAGGVGRKMLDCVNRDYRIGGHAVGCGASIGIALFARAIGVDELLKRADLAMYQAKNAGRNTLRFFDPGMQARVSKRATLAADLRLALRAEQLLLHFQPQVDAAGRVFGAEALLRWRQHDGTLRLPGEFNGLAEESGLILAIGQWVLDRACRQLAEWAAQPGLARLTVAVNVSARQFHQADFVAQVEAALAHSGADPQRLKLELTESLLIADIDTVIAKMKAIAALGVGFALDDFGAGYSSLAHLKRLPLEQLKIDRTFVRDLLGEGKDAAIVHAIVALGRGLGLSVIAEGVENEAQCAELAAIGCTRYQGYHFGRPVPPESLARLANPARTPRGTVALAV